MHPDGSTPRVFVSATSADLAEMRRAVADELRRRDVHAVEQEAFPTDYRGVGHILEDRIRSCHAVIHVVGFRYGGEPAHRPTDAPRRSFSQMEYDAALRLGKPLFVFLASAESVSLGRLPPEPAECRVLQEAHRSEVRRRDQVWYEFASEESLRELVRRIPSHALCPPIVRQNLPYCSLGPLFVGRDSCLDELAARTGITAARSNALRTPLAIVATGGMGKTRLAVEFAWRRMSEFAACLYVRATSRERLRQTVGALAGSGVLPVSIAPDADEPAQFEAALSWLADHRGWLLVVDEVDSEEAAEAVVELLPRLHSGQVLVTARHARWPPAVERMELTELDRDEAARFLLARTDAARSHSASDRDDARALADAVGGLALALEQAGAYVTVHRCSLRAFLANWRSREPGVVGSIDPRLSSYPVSVAVAWDASLEQLSHAARMLLEVVAWFEYAPIPVRVFERMSFDMSVRLTLGSRVRRLWRSLWRRGPRVPAPRGRAASREGSARYVGGGLPLLLELEALSLVRRTVDGDLDLVHLHRVLQDVIRARPRVVDRRQALRIGAHVIAECFLDVCIPEQRRFVEALIPHASQLERVMQSREHAASLGRLYRLHAHAKFSLRRFQEAEGPGREAVRWLRETHQVDELVLALSGLATTLGMLGRLDEALTLATESEGIAVSVLDEDPELADISGEALAPLLASAGRAEEAERVLDRVFARPPRPGAAGALGRGSACRLRGDALAKAGRPGDARRWFEKGLDVLREVEGPQGALARSDCHRGLAEAAHAQGESEEACAQFARSLAAMGDGAATSTADFARVEMELGSLLGQIRRYAEAIDHLAHAAEVLGERLGPGDDMTLLCRTRLASVCMDAGSYDLAEQQAEQVIELAWPEGSGPGKRGLSSAMVLAFTLLKRGALDRLSRFWDRRAASLLEPAPDHEQERALVLQSTALGLALVGRLDDAARAIDGALAALQADPHARPEAVLQAQSFRRSLQDAHRRSPTRRPGRGRGGPSRG